MRNIHELFQEDPVNPARSFVKVRRDLDNLNPLDTTRGDDLG